MKLAAQSRGDVTDALKGLAKAIAFTLPVALLRAVAVVAVFGTMNAAFALWVFIHAGMGGHGHAGIAGLPLAAIPFAPFFAMALGLAHAQAVSQVLTAAVVSQSRALTLAGERTLALFLESNRNLWLQNTQAAFGRAWLKFLRTRSTLPWPARILLSRLCSKVGVFEVLEALSAKGVSAEELPREFMTEVMARASSGVLRPRWRAPLLLLAANLVWFGAFYVWLPHF